MRQTIKIVLDKTLGFRSDIALICLAGIVGVVATLSMVYLSKRVIDIATGQAAGDMLIYSLMLAVAFGVIILASAATSHLTKITEIKLQTRLQRSLFLRLLDADPAMVEKYRSGDLVSRLEQDVRETAKLISDSLPTAITTIIQLLAAFAFFFLLDAKLALITFCIMPICLLAGRVYFRRMRRLTHQIRQTDGRIQSLMQESILHGTTIKTLEASNHLSDKAGEMQGELYGLVKERTRYNVLSRTAVMTGFAGGYLAVFLWGAYGLREGAITFGLMAAFLQLAGQIQRPVVGLASLLPSLISGVASIERLNELEEMPTEESGELQMLKHTAGVRLQNVMFSYDDRKKAVFSDLSFDFHPGTSTAIVGETGAGKTSLIRLILGLRKPDKGEIVIYDSFEEHSVSPLTRANFVYVPQGNTLFSGTVRDNLLMAKPTASETEMAEVLTTACAEFVFDLPRGLDTPCREQGGGLSEGQAQRIAVARALLRPGSILLLDEATSALDADTEKRMLQNLKAHAADKTLIFITHRVAAGSEFYEKVLSIE